MNKIYGSAELRVFIICRLATLHTLMRAYLLTFLHTRAYILPNNLITYTCTCIDTILTYLNDFILFYTYLHTTHILYSLLLYLHNYKHLLRTSSFLEIHLKTTLRALSESNSSHRRKMTINPPKFND